MDREFRLKVTAAISRATSSGQDVAEYLNRYGLLATPQWKNRLRSEAVDFMVDAIESTPTLGLSGAQVVHVIVKLGRMLALKMGRGEWRE
jgi:hypothetical protein